MKRNQIIPPVIIIGMHRSGTSMLSRILEQLGLFVGAKKEENNEAIFFLKINQRILEYYDCDSLYPKSIHEILAKEEVKEKWRNEILRVLQSKKLNTFLGSNLYKQYGSLFNLNIPWGWKDPRNTFTLPIWLDLFPEARVIHIFRHGVDVAQSLKVRLEYTKKSTISRVTNYIKNRHGRSISKQLRIFGKPQQIEDLEGGFFLWEKYIQEAKKGVLSLKERAHEIQYEDLLAEPIEIIKSTTNFCNLVVDEEKINEVCKVIIKGRRYAFKGNHELELFEKRVRDKLRVYGY
ncbi:MAG: sulfotransferase [Candidatus Hodarchaeota archaeon]